MLPRVEEMGVPDRELACAPADSPEGRRYLGAMAAAANFAWANRQTIVHHVRTEWRLAFPGDELRTLYDVSHNIAKAEEHEVGGARRSVLVHRKGATRAFGPGRPEVPAAYREVGQPVALPGTMGTASYLLRGTDEAMARTFGSACHGAGRRMSRGQARREVKGEELARSLRAKGIEVRCFSPRGLAEEAPLAYKDVVRVVEQAGIARKVARLRPIAVVKGE
jgi:tRNA-splicing ligase RtcB